ncbi:MULTISPECIES: hypothetical protein [Pseudomonas syringae group]|uniref:hypothetical protein n=1 Tax=Pseudomonas syringae group TaxID=136849 RepID=UPI0016050839|nr:hypothetical protein [Pseudomonas syringae group genomosp. 3]
MLKPIPETEAKFFGIYPAKAAGHIPVNPGRATHGKLGPGAPYALLLNGLPANAVASTRLNASIAASLKKLLYAADCWIFFSFARAATFTSSLSVVFMLVIQYRFDVNTVTLGSWDVKTFRC